MENSRIVERLAEKLDNKATITLQGTNYLPFDDRDRV